MDRGDEKRAEKARRILDEGVEHLDAATLSRLNRARHEALAAAAKSGGRRGWWWGFPAGAMAAAALAAVIWWPRPMTEPTPVPGIEDMEILVSADSLEMLEDLEFFMWLEEADVDAG